METTSDIIIKNLNEVYVQIHCSDSISYELRDAFTFHVPGYQFTPQFRAKLWDGKIRLYDVRKRLIYRGLIQHIISFAQDRNYMYTYDTVYDTEFSYTEGVQFAQSINTTKEPRDYQLEAFVHAIRTKRTLLLSPTASGKSFIIYLILRYIQDKLDHKKTLIIVPTTSLVSQLFTDFKDYGFDSDSNVHKIYSGQDKDTEKRVVISTWQSLFKLPRKYFEQYDSVFVDECHLAKAKSLTDIMVNLTNADYRIGTTGTLDGTKTHKLVIEGLTGPVKKVITTKELMDQKHIADFEIKCLVLKHSDSICQAAKNFTYQQEIEYLVLNEQRNQFISNLAVSLKGNTLILYQYVDKHGKILHDIINRKIDKDRKVFFVYGKTDVDVREDIRKIVETEKDAIIVASFGVFSTGVNLRNLHNIIFASPSKSRVRNLQSIGRGLRKSDTKSNAVLYDIADDLRWKKHNNYTIKHFLSRIQIYAEEKFVFKVYKIQLKG
jgi:superfamily II DNA or RNA helicase